MNILLTNDDGINADGIVALHKVLSPIASITVVAPDSEKSAVGHAITLSDPLRVKRVGENQFAVSGTPADCVKLAVRTIMKKKPDMIISGINLGPNIGYSILYSGTVSGATEGAILGIPSFAISLGTFEKPDYSAAAQFAKKLAKLIHKNGLPKNTLLNVNVPAVKAGKIKGVKITRQSKAAIIEHFEKRVDPRKHVYYWLTGEVIKLEGEDESDIKALRDGYISIVPLHCDMTDYELMNALKEWGI